MIFRIFAPLKTSNEEKMKKSIYPFLLLTLLLLVSCKSKKRMVATLPRLVLNTDSIVADTSNVIAGLFAPDHSQLKDLNVSKGRKRRAKKNKSSADAYKSEEIGRAHV